MNVWSWVLAIHILGAVLWVGGMFFALMVMRPSLATLDPATRLALHVPVLKRFLLVVWHAMPLMLITGWLMVFGVYGGFANLPLPVNLMQLLGIVMAIVFLVLFFGPWKRFRAAPAPDLLERIRRLITVNLWLGIITVVLGALGHFG
jgi:uncharacterized membrane protein